MIVLAAAIGAALIAGSVTWRLGLRRTRRVEARMAVERAAFEALAHEDPLTGLPNKRAFDTRFGILSRPPDVAAAFDTTVAP